MFKPFLIVCFYIAFANAAPAPAEAAGYFKCKDTNGRIIFSDIECPIESEVLTEKTVSADAVTGRFSSEPYVDDSDMSLEDMFKLRSHLSQAMSDITPIKLAITEHYLQNEAWPKHLNELGFDPGQTNSERIDSIKIGEEGAVVAMLNDSLGADKMIVLSPNEAMDGTLIEWECAANFSPLLTNGLSCEARNIYP